MFEYFTSLAIIILEVYCCKFFFETFFDAEEEKQHNIYMILLVMWNFLCAYSEYFNIHVMQKQVVVIISIAVCMYLHFRASIKKILVFSMLYESLLLLMDYIIYIFCLSLFPADLFGKDNYILESIMLIAFGKLLLFLCCVFIRKKIWEGKTNTLPETEMTSFLFFPAFTIIASVAMYSGFGDVEDEKQIITILIVTFGLVVMNMLIFYMLNNIVKKEIILRQKQLFEVQGKSQMEMYQFLSENYRKQQEKSHEYVNQMVCIRNLLQNGEYEELEQYVEKISGKMEEGHNLINTNHPVINSVLNTKYREAIKREIVCVFKINDLSNLDIAEDDMVIILSNLLNNAIEACEKCKGKKIIKLKIVKEENEVIISVKNTYEQSVIFKSNHFVTTKNLNFMNHGIGIKNVIQAVEKNNGSYNIDYKNKEFYFAIVLPSTINNK